MRIVETQDGSHTVISPVADVGYHSRYGAVQESRHVFIEAGLNYKSVGSANVRVLEIGFGTALNAFMTFLEAEKRQLPIDYTGVDNLPLEREIYSSLNYTDSLQANSFSNVYLRMHETAWGESIHLSDYFSFTKLLADFEEVSLTGQYEVIYYDAFAPDYAPSHWEVPILLKMYDALQHTGVLVTYCAKGSFKRNLKAAGFMVESLKGPPGKREMVRAIKN